MAEEDPKVSVIIPTYNRAHLLPRAVKSVLNQTYQGFELIVVDDGSTDNTEKIVKGFDDERIRYIRHRQNKGGAAARNTGIRAARGEYIAFLDSDDEWLPEKLKKQLKVFKDQDLQIGVVYTGFVVKENSDFEINRFLQHQGYILKELLISNCVGTTSTVMVKRECFERVGTFDEILPSCQDWDMWIRIANLYKFNYISEELVRYFIHTSRISTNPEAVVVGHETIFKKFQTEIEEQGRKVKARHYFRLGNYLCHFGGIRVGRKYFLQAVLAFPWNPKYFLYFFASIFGGRIFLKLAQIKPKKKQVFQSLIKFVTKLLQLQWKIGKKER